MNVTMISDLLETLMIIGFGLSWPFSVYKSYKSRTAKGKSLQFEFFIWLGYIFGIARKFLQYHYAVSYDWLFLLSWFFYVLNFVEISFDMWLYVRNIKLDKEREGEAAGLS
ncbi:hypothetical protein RZO55_01085 [Clostridium boliviensis]|uniref:PQ-loop repeat-containing protein n=1 Tax=Clostridium boliviensis TaxID=318465 RepID=A0ABU4GEX9_9CLOT|nr:hypothetical protein [Clostridium boliviensis]MDW2796181.1 hypothetical protein [Clostridium boliviensis]